MAQWFIKDAQEHGVGVTQSKVGVFTLQFLIFSFIYYHSPSFFSFCHTLCFLFWESHRWLSGVSLSLHSIIAPGRADELYRILGIKLGFFLGLQHARQILPLCFHYFPNFSFSTSPEFISWFSEEVSGCSDMETNYEKLLLYIWRVTLAILRMGNDSMWNWECLTRIGVPFWRQGQHTQESLIQAGIIIKGPECQPVHLPHLWCEWCHSWSWKIARMGLLKLGNGHMVLCRAFEIMTFLSEVGCGWEKPPSSSFMLLVGLLATARVEGPSLSMPTLPQVESLSNLKRGVSFLSGQKSGAPPWIKLLLGEAPVLLWHQPIPG